jgi:hypothetical protein
VRTRSTTDGARAGYCDNPAVLTHVLLSLFNVTAHILAAAVARFLLLLNTTTRIKSIESDLQFLYIFCLKQLNFTTCRRIKFADGSVGHDYTGFNDL